MKCIEENTEQLDLLQKTLQVEEKQKKRLMDLSVQNQKEIEISQRKQLYDGYLNSTTTTSMLDQEEAERKLLVDEMVRTSTPSNAPTVRVLTNLQGNIAILVVKFELKIYISLY